MNLSTLTVIKSQNFTYHSPKQHHTLFLHYLGASIAQTRTRPISQYPNIPKSQVLKSKNPKIRKFRNPKIEITSHNTHQSSTIRCFYTIRVQASRKRVRAPGPESASSCQAPLPPSPYIPHRCDMGFYLGV